MHTKVAAVHINTSRADKLNLQIKQAVHTLHTYANWHFWNYKEHYGYTGSVLNQLGLNQLNTLQYVKSLADNNQYEFGQLNVERLLDNTPTIQSLHKELFVSLFPGMTGRQKIAMLRLLISIPDWFGSASLLQIGRGCYNLCAFCQFQTVNKMTHLPLPMFDAGLDELEYFGTRNPELLLHRDDDSFLVRDIGIGAHFGHYYKRLIERGFNYGLLSASWAVTDHTAQAAGEMVAEIKGSEVDLSFNIYRKQLLQALETKNPILIETAYQRLKSRWKNTISTLKPIIREIDLEYGRRRQDKTVDALTDRMYKELCNELHLGNIEKGTYDMSWLPQNKRQKRDYDFLDGETTKGYFILRPHGGPVEIGYTGDKLISFKRLISSSKIDKQKLALLLESIRHLIINKYKNISIKISDIKGTLLIAKRDLLFLKNVYKIYYPAFLAHIQKQQEITIKDVDYILANHPDIPVPNGLAIRHRGQKAQQLIRAVWLQNRNQEFQSEHTYFQPLNPQRTNPE